MAVIDLYHVPGSREVRRFAGLGLPVLAGILGALTFWAFASPTAGIAIWAVGGALSLTGLAFPSALKPLLIGMMIVTFPLRWAIFHLALAALFYLVVTPIGLLMRLFRRSPLRAFRTTGESSAWQARRPDASMAEYFRQH